MHDAGLARRRHAYYAASILGWILALAGTMVAVAFLSDTWFQLAVAILAGVVLTQLGFLTHEAAHRSIFASRAWNEWTSRCISALLMGLSYSWWMAKHNSHHANPNKEDADPMFIQRSWFSPLEPPSAEKNFLLRYLVFKDGPSFLCCVLKD